MTYRNRKLLDLGQKFGRLTVLSFTRRVPGGSYWFCRCECGKEKDVLAGHLKSGRTVSCGCWAADKARERATHGLSQSRTYWAWRSMLNRCYWPKESHYEYYGGRGITVCESWRKSFAAFLSDLGQVPAEMSLERKDSNGNYEPGNCCWATRIEQANNKRSNVCFDYLGERVTMKQLSERCGVKYKALFWRLRVAKWDFERAITP